MPPKRQRPEVGSSSRPPRRELKPHEINKHGLVFKNQAQKDSYDKLIVRGIQATCFLDYDVLNRFHLREDVHWLFMRLGWNCLWDARWPTFEKYTLEFLSSLKVELSRSSRVDAGKIEFRLDGRDISLTLEQFNEIYGFPIDGERGVQVDFKANSFWKQISSESNYDASKAKSTTIVNPIFRYMQRTMANTIFARDDSQGVARLAELFVLWAALNEVQIDTGYYLAQQLAQVASRNRGPIVIGGMIMPLLENFRCPFHDLEPVAGPRSLDLFFCIRIHLFEEKGRVWVIKQHQHVTVPDRERTTIHRRENWLFEDLPRASPSHPTTSADPSSSDPIFFLEYPAAPSSSSLPPRHESEFHGMSDRIDEMHQRLMNMEIRQQEDHDMLVQLYHHFFPPPPPEADD